ncbi:MAG: hypothetical protein HQ518_29445 [Rhodopirellula sp.]|nr:hypothetical protein [Rhodopirellula sp.]
MAAVRASRRSFSFNAQPAGQLVTIEVQCRQPRVDPAQPVGGQVVKDVLVVLQLVLKEQAPRLIQRDPDAGQPKQPSVTR